VTYTSENFQKNANNGDQFVFLTFLKEEYAFSQNLYLVIQFRGKLDFLKILTYFTSHLATKLNKDRLQLQIRVFKHFLKKCHLYETKRQEDLFYSFIKEVSLVRLGRERSLLYLK
jgi:hypothetical protein